MDKLKSTLPECIESFCPDFVIYNAGNDILEGDPLAKMHLGRDAVIARDEYVFEQVYQKHKIPIVMLPSGGFLLEAASALSESIENLIRKFNLPT
jgi:acetoin utilization deacetylase AcuC-like enzyme